MAEGAQSEEIVKRINATLECSICMETYTDPRILDCVHSFCFKCIRTHVGNSPVIKCPLCNIESPVPVDAGIEGLKSNFFIKGLIDDVMHKVESNEESVPAVCGSCDLGNVAKSHWDDCDCELCDQCIQLHRQLKIFKLHKFTLYPTDEEIKAQKEAKVIRKITLTKNNIATNISELQGQISQVQGKVKAVNIERDTTISQVNEAHQRFVKEIQNYVKGLTTRIEEHAGKRIVDLSKPLKAYETQLNTYQALEKQWQCMLDFNLDEKMKLCNELDGEIKKHKVRTSLDIYPDQDVATMEFVPENEDLEMQGLLEQAIGFLTPVKTRCEREVDINEKEMSNKMRDYAVECAHEALDIYGMCQSNSLTLDNIAEHIINRYAERYNRGKWSCFVAKADMAYRTMVDKSVDFTIDRYYILLLQ